MRAVLYDEPGGPEKLYLGQYPDPVAGEGELLIHVAATALNRADTYQRRGSYPPPEGESPILGLEMAGTVLDVGPGVQQFEVGDNVCGLLGGGGYAEYAVLHEHMALRLPLGMSFSKAAAVPEAFLTAFQALYWIGNLQAGETVLIHAGASGVGTAAIQLARQSQATIYTTASAMKHETCLQLGAHRAIDYRQEEFADVVQEITEGRGVDLIIDFIGGPYFKPNLDALALDGRLVILSMLGGSKAESVPINTLLRKRLQVTASTLRSRSAEYKKALTSDFRERFWPLFEDRTLYPVVDSIYDWSEAAEAHRYMESNANQGKIVLTIGER